MSRGIRGPASILFVLKEREGYWGSYDVSSGLLNSVTFIVDLLVSLGVRAELVQVVDNNKIDAAIFAFKPDIVVFEAFWVVPSKVAVLKKLYPNIRFVVRNHSDMPFLSNEGIAMEWTGAYLKQGVEIMCNSPKAVEDMKGLARSLGGLDRLISYAPNYYPIGPVPGVCKYVTPRNDDTVKIGCFGSIRPLKNQLVQAIASIRFAYLVNRKLEFHINGGRVEGYGAPILKNLIALFDGLSRAKLVQHPWLKRGAFLSLMASMDYSLQVSLSETFNIVSADAVLMEVPVIGSSEIPWLGSYAWADPSSSTSIMENLMSATHDIRHQRENNRIIWQHRDLYNYSQESKQYWASRFA